MLKEKTFVITGANRGIGFETLKCCSENGGDVFAVVRNITDETKKKFEQVEKEFNNKIKIFQCDFSNQEAIKNCASDILSEKIQISGLANIAGVIGAKKLFTMTTMDEIRSVFEINFFGPLYFTQRLLKNMIRNKSGSIVNVSSIAAFDGGPGELEYCTSKMALVGTTKKLAKELGVFNIRVNSVAPGVTETDMISTMDEKLLNDTMQRTSLKNLAKPREIAEAIVWLLSDKSSFITGQTIRVDGGM